MSGVTSNLLTVSSNCVENGNNNSGCGCNNSNENQGENLAINANFVPCQNNNGRTGFVRGCYRRIR